MAKAKKSARKLSAREQLEAALEHQRAGRFDRAQQICEQLLARTPKLAPAHAILGALALSRGAPEAALASLDRAIALEHGHVGAHLNRGNALRALGRDAEAAQAYRTALALDGSSAFAHNNLANLLRDHGRLDEAIASYERALALDPGLYAAAANLASVLAGRAASPGSEPASRERAIEAHERALAIAGARGLRDLSVATCHNTLGNLLLAAGRTADALASYRRAIELDPAFGEAHLNLGALLARPGSVEDALTHLRRGRELTPDY
ncbi:MAG: tetratricopeptide repeat protein, partial [Sandaracinaceae bacterium]|nr:tetratricopeptide repeat protein [Sandaracinaceae bacterium]